MKKVNVVSKLIVVFCVMVLTFAAVEASAQTNECAASFDFQSMTLHVPCFSLDNQLFWLDLSLISADPIQFQLVNFGEKIYGNASLSGAWIFYEAGDNDLYMVFDGAGGIDDIGAFNMGPSTYQAQPDGALTFTFNGNDGAMTFQGKMTSATTAISTDPISGGKLEKVSDISLFQGTWTGTLTETSTAKTYNMTFTVDANGRITSLSGFAGPISGRAYGIPDHAVAMIRTGETVNYPLSGTNPYNQIQLNGTLSGNSYIGVYAVDNGPGNDGTFILTR